MWLSGHLMKTQLVNLLRQKEITNRQQHFDLSRYDRAVSAYLELVKSYETVRAIYQFGSYSVPGLSDIDLAVVMNDGAADCIYRYSITRLSAEDQYLFSHDPLFMNERHFRHMHLWFPVKEADRRHLWGHDIARRARGSHSRYQKIIHLAQMLVSYQLQLLCRYSYFGSTFDERVSESALKGLCNSLALWIEICGNDVHGKYVRFHNEFLRFRPQWFNLDETERTERMFQYIAEGTLLTFDLIGDLNRLVLDSWFDNEVKRCDVEVVMGGSRLAFVSNWDSALAVQAFRDQHGLLYPLGFGLFLRLYRNSTGFIGRHIRALFDGLANNAPRLRDQRAAEAFETHLNALDDYSGFMPSKFKVPPNPFVTYWAPYTRNRIVRVYHRIYNRAYKLMMGA